MSKRFLLLALVTVSFFFTSNSFAQVGTQIIFVSPKGNDKWSGALPEPLQDSSDGPLLTLEAARNQIRKQKTLGKAQSSFTVQIREGVYYLENTFVLEPQDSGSVQAPILYTAYPGEKPVLSGGFVVDGFSLDDKGWWKASLNKDKRKEAVTQLFVNGERRPRPRLPKVGYYRIAGFAGADPKAKYNTSASQFEYGDVPFDPHWRNLQDVEIIVHNFWVSPRLTIKSIDTEKKLVDLNGKTTRRLTNNYTKEGARYYIENIFEELSEPGEWYYDKKTEELFYIPKQGEQIGKTEVVIPRLENLILLKGNEKAQVEYVEFRGITFSNTACSTLLEDAGNSQAAWQLPSAMNFVASKNCRLSQSLFRGMGGYAVDVSKSCCEIKIEANEIRDCGGGGIKISGGTATSPESSKTKQISVTDNHIHDIGFIYAAGIGVLIQHASDCVVAYNEIDHTFYSGISVGWVWGPAPSVSGNNLVEYNHIHDIGQGVLSDMGGVYTLGTSPGTRVQFNLIHDVEGWDYGSRGIYLDEGSTWITVENNLVYRCSNSTFFQHQGGENYIRNNIFALAREEQMGSVPPQKWKLEGGMYFERNIVYWKEGEVVRPSTKYLQNKIDANLYYKEDGPKFLFAGMTLAQWRATGFDQNSKIGNPLFRDADHGDFTLDPQSPAGEIGFKPFDLSKVGPRVPVGITGK